MDEYPEYDFYNSREECDGKKLSGGERGGKTEGRWIRMRKEARHGGRHNKK